MLNFNKKPGQMRSKIRLHPRNAGLKACLIWDFSGARSGPMTAAVAGFSSTPWPEFGPPHTLLLQRRNPSFEIGKRRIVLCLDDAPPCRRRGPQALQMSLRLCQLAIGVRIRLVQPFDPCEDIILLVLERHDVVARAKRIDCLTTLRYLAF